MSDITFSVVVCSYNHADLLRRALAALGRQTFDPSRYEIIVVDNNSRDATRAVTEEFAARDPRIRYCFEPTQGLSHARNCGLKEARGLYVAYLDDDCRPPADWLRVASDIVDRVSPMAMGGPYHADFGGVKPAWASESFHSYIPFADARVLKPEEYWALVGGNVFFRRSVFGVVGGFDPRFGHVGETLAYGDETDVLEKISNHSPGALYYDPRLYVNHLVRPDKLTLSYTLRASFGAGRSSVRRGRTPSARPPGRLLLSAAAAMVRLTADVLVHVAVRDRRKYPHFRSYFDQNTLTYVRQLGSVYEQSRSR
jgi:glucosyl-dolichyl phosphate glucuronosyltransferase